LMSVARGLVEPGMRGMPFWSVSCSVEVRGRKRTRVRGSPEDLRPGGRRRLTVTVQAGADEHSRAIGVFADPRCKVFRVAENWYISLAR
jgi:hypothetical protein